MTKISHILEGWWLWLTADKKTEALAQQRKVKCDGCIRKTKVNTCEICGCYLPAKRRVLEASCPIDEW
jgi:hypothetical protein